MAKKDKPKKRPQVKCTLRATSHPHPEYEITTAWTPLGEDISYPRVYSAKKVEGHYVLTSFLRANPHDYPYIEKGLRVLGVEREKRIAGKRLLDLARADFRESQERSVRKQSILFRDETIGMERYL